jgi:hypothetical protein
MHSSMKRNVICFLGQETVTCTSNARFEVFTAVKIQVDIFWLVTPCGNVVGSRSFGRSCCLLFRAKWLSVFTDTECWCTHAIFIRTVCRFERKSVSLHDSYSISLFCSYLLSCRFCLSKFEASCRWSITNENVQTVGAFLVLFFDTFYKPANSMEHFLRS